MPAVFFAWLMLYTGSFGFLYWVILTLLVAYSIATGE